MKTPVTATVTVLAVAPWAGLTKKSISCHTAQGAKARRFLEWHFSNVNEPLFKNYYLQLS